MKSVFFHSHCEPVRRVPHAYTIVEILVATTLTLLMMAGVATLFGSIGQTITDSRSTLEMADRLRTAQLRLQKDLASVTVTVAPPRDPDDNEGYLEATEGPIGPVVAPGAVAKNLDRPDPSDPSGYAPDTTVGDVDDMLMFTTRSKTEPFTGRVFIKRSPQPGEPADGSDGVGNYVIVRTAQSTDAEVAWFVRGRTLYRRVFLILPQFDADLRVNGIQMQLDTRRGPPYSPPFPVVNPPGPGFHNDYDVSVSSNNNTTAFANFNIRPNSLGMLTKPENRYAHRIYHRFVAGAGGAWSGYPFHPRFNLDWTVASPPSITHSAWYSLGLPTLRETAFRIATGMTTSDDDPLDPSQPLDYSASWMAAWPLTPMTLNPRAAPYNNFDAWTNPHPVQDLEPMTGTLTGYVSSPQMRTRLSEDVILTNVVGFDVKVWDPGAPILEVANTTQGQRRIVMPSDATYVFPEEVFPERMTAYPVAIRNRGTTAPDPVTSDSFQYRVVGYGAYVDLNYMCLVGPHPADARRPDYDPPANAPEPHFHGPGQVRSLLPGTLPYARDFFADPADWPVNLRSAVYDTWSTHYGRDEPWWIDRNGDGTPQPIEVEGNQDRDGVFNEGTNGFDDPVDASGRHHAVPNPPNIVPNGQVDEDLEQEAPPPYPHPLRGIQVKIRVYEPDSRQIREVTVVEEF